MGKLPKILAGVIGICAVLVGVGVKLGGWAPSESSTDLPELEPRIIVEVAPVTIGSMKVLVQDGLDHPRPEIAGVIRRIHFKDGQVVDRHWHPLQR